MPPRLAPVDPPYDPELADTLQRLMGAAPDIEPLRLFRTIAHHRQILDRFRQIGSTLLSKGTLAPAERETVIHRVTARAGAEYEWGVHAVAFGRPLGLTDEQVAATATGDAGDPAWTGERDRLLVRLVDELHDTATVSDELWDALAREWEPPQLLELVVCAGWYRLIAQVINAARVDLEPWAERFPAPAGQRGE